MGKNDVLTFTIIYIHKKLKSVKYVCNSFSLEDIKKQKASLYNILGKKKQEHKRLTLSRIQLTNTDGILPIFLSELYLKVI